MLGVSLSGLLALQLFVGFGSAIAIVILAIFDLGAVARLRAARGPRAADTIEAPAAVVDSAMAGDSRRSDQPLAA